ncbi:Transcriptional regulatory protein LiaR [Propionicimonas sp. T2.31MG-18]|uniref:response regulator n=1 Tax=Propionicimonas sp. T2.31MG-18 TaxID=3157620 RepID=UPI0035ED1932
MPEQIRVVLVDDQQLVRAGLAMVIDAQPDMTVAGQAGSGAEAIALVAATPCDIVLMDVRMPGMDGLEATRRILEAADAGGAASPPRLVMLTTYDLDEYLLSAISAGASGFLLKNAPPADLLAAIRTVHTGDAVIAPSATRRLLAHVAANPSAPGPDPVDPRLATLTDREREVLELIARGLSNAEISSSLYLSETTVKTHVRRVLAKLGVRDRVQAVVVAYESGLARGGA